MRAGVRGQTVFRTDPAAVAEEIIERRHRRGRAFDAAARHSGRVRWMRRAIPFFGIMVALFAGASFLGGTFRSGDSRASVEELGLSGSKVTMQAPRLSGFKKDSRGYQVVATDAAQDLKKPNLVELNAPVATLEMEQNGWAKLSAGTGVFDSATERFEAVRDVRVQTDSGVDARLKNAKVDFKSGTVETDAPVTVESPQGTISAETMKVLDNGRRMVFEGNVKSMLIGAEDPTAPAALARGETVPPAGLRKAQP